MKHERVYISGAANTVSGSSLWIQQGQNISFVAYAVHNLIAIVDVFSNSVICTLRSHISRINVLSHCVSELWVDVISASDDGSLHVWRHNFSDSLNHWHRMADLTGHKSSITTVSVMSIADRMLVSASDSLGLVNVWLCEVSGENKIVGTFRLPPAQMAYTMYLSKLPEPNNDQSLVCLFIGCVDAKIHIYVAAAAQLERSDCAPSAMFRSVGNLYGHEEWVTCLAASIVDDKTLMLASGSQDSKVRVWKVQAQAAAPAQSDDAQSLSLGGISLTSAEPSDAAAAVDDDNDDDEAVEGEVIQSGGKYDDDDEALSEARLRFTGADGRSVYAVFLDALLVGHEDWVTSLHWMPPCESAPAARLFSTCMDRNMVVWAQDEAAGGIWVPEVRVGDIGGALGGSVGGNLLGFVGGCMAADGSSVLGIGYGGSFHMWSKSKQLSRQSERSAPTQTPGERWYPVPFLSGHFGSVNDVAWSRSATNTDTDAAQQNGSYLISVSADQTCRLHAALRKPTAAPFVGTSADASSSGVAAAVWKEVSRPQIHGYDMNCVALLPASHVLFTGGEEKLIRVFDAPGIVLDGLRALCGIRSTVESASARIPQAYLPELGLSNKARETMSSQERTEQEARSVSVIDWSVHPLESQLADHTLWPETKKLFGHSNDVMCMDLSADGRWLASANKARDAKTAQIALWDAASMDLVARLPGHDSTVVTVEFSPDSRFLASSGKDRALCLYRRVEATTDSTSSSSSSFEHCVYKKSAHKRIVWDCSWTGDSAFLVSASRDGFCKVWRVVDTEAGGADLDCVFAFSPFDGTAVTAVDIRPSGSLVGGWLVALGAESGDVQVGVLGGDGASYAALCKVDSQYCHGATVRCVRWRPSGDGDGGDSCMELASCGEDNTVRIHRFTNK